MKLAGTLCFLILYLDSPRCISSGRPHRTLYFYLIDVISVITIIVVEEAKEGEMQIRIHVIMKVNCSYFFELDIQEAGKVFLETIL